MDSSIYRFTLDMNSAQSQISIPVLLGDTGRKWHITLSDGDGAYKIEEGCMAMLEIKRPNGTNFNELCLIVDGSTILYDFAQNENTCIEVGVHDCDIILYGTNGRVLTSARFTMVGFDRVIPKRDVIASSSDQTKVDSWALQEATRQLKETERQTAETARISAEEQRASAEAERSASYGKFSEEAKASAEEAKAYAEEAKEAAEEAKEAAEEAKASAGGGNISAIPNDVIDSIVDGTYYHRKVYVAGLEFTFDKGMTWGEFIDSAYNPEDNECYCFYRTGDDGSFEFDDFMGYFEEGLVGMVYLESDTSKPCVTTDTIIAGASYVVGWY